MPPFLSLGFNRPVSSSGLGIAVDDQRLIEFTGGTHDDHPLRLFGLTGRRSVGHHSQMRLVVVASTPGRVVFRIDEDTTMLSQWARLNRAVITWVASGSGTRVSWRLEYERLLSPAAYFAPLQRFGLGQAAEYLLDAAIGSRLK